MIFKFVGLCAFLGAISLSASYTITPNVIDGIPGFSNITTAPFVKIGSNYYFIEGKIKRNWYDAYESCRQMDADLIAFNNLEELNEMYQYLLKTNEGGEFWTAGTDLAKQGDHVWFSNGQPVSSDLWRKGEPNNENNAEHCDNIWISNGHIGLNDDRCEKYWYYVCQAPQPKTASFIIW